MENLLSRRGMLKIIPRSIALYAMAPAFMSSCKKDQEFATNNASFDLAPACPDQLGLSEEYKSIRANLKYVDQTPVRERTCDNCKLYTLPRTPGACGGCRAVPGPIHPKGYCISWYARM